MIIFYKNNLHVNSNQIKSNKENINAYFPFNNINNLELI